MKSDLEKLQGTWQMIAFEMDGQSIPPASARRVFRGNQTTMFVFDRVYMKSRFTVNRASTPSTLDYLDTSQSGIYQVSGEKLRTSLAAAREPRRPRRSGFRRTR